jgi:RNA polymerase sigma factor (sigma-70 family)
LLSIYSDIAIIEGLRRQDEKILKWLYKFYLPLIKKHIQNNSGNDEDAMDVFQDTIIILYKHIQDDSFELTTDLKGFFFGIARNIWHEQLRRIGRTTELTDDSIPEEETDDQKDIVLESIVARAFLKLKPDQQEILNLFSDGISYDDIAVKMNLKNETYARRKKYLSKESLLELVREDPEYQLYLRLLK